MTGMATVMLAIGAVGGFLIFLARPYSEARALVVIFVVCLATLAFYSGVLSYTVDHVVNAWRWYSYWNGA